MALSSHEKEVSYSTSVLQVLNSDDYILSQGSNNLILQWDNYCVAGFSNIMFLLD